MFPRAPNAPCGAPDPACEDTSVQRVVTAELDLELGSSVDLILLVAAAQHVPIVIEELTFIQGEQKMWKPVVEAIARNPS